MALTTMAAMGAGMLLYERLDRRMQLAWDVQTGRRLLPMKIKMAQLSRKKDFNLADVWEETVAKHRHRTAVVFEGRTYSFDALDKLANQMANWLLSKGLKKGDILALYMENKPEYLVVWLGATKISVVSALINSNLRGKGLNHCLKISDAKLLVFGHESAEAIAEVEPDVRALGCSLHSFGGDVSFADSRIDSALSSMDGRPIPTHHRKGSSMLDTWAFVYTSGTTGLPKAAIVTNIRFWNAGAAFCSYYDLTEQDKIYTVLPLYHSAGGNIGIGMMVYSGATIVLKRKFSATQFIPDIRENDCTVFQYIGELCRYLLATPASTLDQQHKLRIGIGNGLRPDIWETFQRRFAIPEIGEFYAATEGNAYLFNRVYLNGEGAGSVGRMGTIMNIFIPIKIVKFDVNTEEVVRGPDGLCIECAPGEAGELVGRINNKDPTLAFVGYYGNKSGTEKKILKNVFQHGDMFFRTGDLLRRDDRGRFFFVDRIGDTFRWKGENVSTNDVAETLNLFPGVREANVYGVEIPGQDGRAGMVAMVMDDKIDLAALGKYAANSLPSYAVPLFIRSLPEIEVTGTFKHRKVELRQEGFDLDKIADPIFFFDAKQKAYVPFTKAAHNELITGKSKL